ncbi:MAG: AAA family ATPase, partial [Clostridiales bacterium]|nr:AAA family ATPase [Clostridiales bacterium]
MSLIRKAERINRERGGAPSKEECLLYVEAARVCQEIRDQNRSRQAVYTEWEMHRLECEKRAEEIADIIAPIPPADPEPLSPKKQAPSGFTTKNAVKDVPAETIEKWYNPMPNHGFDDVVGMDELKESLINVAAYIGWTRTDAALQIAPLQSYLLYGPPGSGKAFVIEAFARELMEKHGFKFIRLNGGDIHADPAGVAEKTVNIAFQEVIDNAPCIFFIDDIEAVCFGRGKNAEVYQMRLTSTFLQAYSRLSTSGKPV